MNNNRFHKGYDKLKKLTRDYCQRGNACIRARKYVSKSSFDKYKKATDKQKKLRQQVSRWGGDPLSTLDLLERKTSDTVFILGSGPSINDLTEDAWRVIRQNDSFAFNRFVAHSHTPTYYNSERVSVEWLETVVQERPDYRDHVLLMSNAKHFVDWHDASNFRRFENHRFTCPYIVGGALEILDKIFAVVYSNGLALRNGFYFHYRGSLSLVLSLCFLAGYRKIVMLGVDLTKYNYFFENTNQYTDDLSQRLRSELYCERIANPALYGRDQPHGTFSKTRHPTDRPIDEVVKLFNESVVLKNNRRLYVGSPNSELATFLPIYQFPPASFG